jgi:hypothetical protein
MDQEMVIDTTLANHLQYCTTGTYRMDTDYALSDHAIHVDDSIATMANCYTKETLATHYHHLERLFTTVKMAF